MIKPAHVYITRIHCQPCTYTPHVLAPAPHAGSWLQGAAPHAHIAKLKIKRVPTDRTCLHLRHMLARGCKGLHHRLILQPENVYLHIARACTCTTCWLVFACSCTTCSYCYLETSAPGRSWGAWLPPESTHATLAALIPPLRPNMTPRQDELIVS